MNAAVKVQSSVRPQGHSRRRLVIPAWEDHTFSSYALGGKGHGIARLMALGLPTPPALVISTTLARSVTDTGKLPERFLPQLWREMKALELRTGKQFGDSANPLLVSVRSGAMVSMPGMMDTILNVGLTAKVAEALKQSCGEAFVTDCERHLRNGLDAHFVTHLGQLVGAINLVLQSWDSPRAKAYRREHGIAENLGTAITIQQMVFGNQMGAGESGTGVAMSHNPDTAEPVLFGNYLRQAQGHDLVSGEITPEAIETLRGREPALMTELERALAVLQSEVSGPVEVEFTIENGVLYLLQFRREKLSPEATIVHLVREKHARRITRDEVMAAVSETTAVAVASATALAVDPHMVSTAELLGTGTGVTMNAASGRFVADASAAKYWQAQGEPYILVREYTTPDDFELMLGAAGIVTLEGGSTCHAAVVARHQGIPAVIGIGQDAYDRLMVESRKDFAVLYFSITINPETGEIWSGELPLCTTKQRKEVELFLRWKNASKPIIDPELCRKEFGTNQALNDFYLAEAMLVECTDQALAAKINAFHQSQIKETAAVFSTYLPLAVASEVTYACKINLGIAANAALSRVKGGYSLDHRSNWRSDELPKIAKELVSVSNEVVAAFFTDCEIIFRDSGWSNSYGGNAWAEIAAVGKQYWNGDIPAAIFVDRVFNLQHNTGPVFNKHEMVNSNYYEHQLKQQLDLKRRQLTVQEKYTELQDICSNFNQQLLDLFNEGQRKGVWK